MMDLCLKGAVGRMKREDVRLRYQLSILFENMRLKKLSKAEWLLQTRDLLSGLMAMEQDDISADLIYIQFLITIGEEQKAKELLKEARLWLDFHEEKAPICYGYYLYLSLLVSEDRAYAVQVVEKLQGLNRSYIMVWQLQWLLYYAKESISEESANTQTLQYQNLKEMFLKGCRSPFLYLEGRVLLERNHTFLYQFSEFEVQVLLYMFRNEVISDTLVKAVIEYMLQVKAYRSSYVLILKFCYERMPSKELLHAICAMQVQGGIFDASSLPWYELGITTDVFIHGIYEAYMKSIPMQPLLCQEHKHFTEVVIPRQVLEYFLHAGEISEDRRAYLYAYVYEHRVKYIELYKEYEPLMQPFVMESLRRGEMNYGLAYLYMRTLQPDFVPRECYDTFIDICHSCMVSGLEPLEGSLVIQYEHMRDEVVVAYENGRVIVPIFGMDYRLMVEDFRGVRSDAKYAVVEDMMPEDFFSKIVGDTSYGHVKYQVQQLENLDFTFFSKAWLEKVLYILSLEQVTEAFKQELVIQALPYLDVWDEYNMIHQVLDACRLEPNELMELEKRVWKGAFLDNRIGIYGIRFLMDYDEGSLTEHCGIFKLAKEHELDVTHYAGYLLRRMLEQEQVVLAQYPEIFSTYLYAGGDLETLQLFIENRANLGYTKELVLAHVILDGIVCLAKEGVSFSLMTNLWFLREISRKGVEAATDDERELATRLLEQLCQSDIYFAWMRCLSVWCPPLRRKEAIQVLEYIGERKEPIWVQYTIAQGRGQEEALVQSEVMTQIEGTIYVKEFLLFYTERVHYEIYTLQGMQKVLLQQGVLQSITPEQTNDKSRFARINEIQEKREKRQLEEVYDNIGQYYKLGGMVDAFFHIK
ncbi:MAG: DUF5717 family protein [Lachnospiraceae bacterium]